MIFGIYIIPSMVQQTLVLVKPDGVKRNLIGEIIKRFEERGLKVVKLEMMTADSDLLAKHYQLDNYDYILTLGHVDVTGWTDEQKEEKYQKSYKVIQALQQFMMTGPIVKMVVEGEEAVPLVREIVGKTDPSKADKGTIRGDFGEDSFEQSDKEGRAVYNLVHASGTPEEAEAEIKLWFNE